LCTTGWTLSTAHFKNYDYRLTDEDLPMTGRCTSLRQPEAEQQIRRLEGRIYIDHAFLAAEWHWPAGSIRHRIHQLSMLKSGLPRRLPAVCRAHLKKRGTTPAATVVEWTRCAT
jgi:hypothetical protein